MGGVLYEGVGGVLYEGVRVIRRWVVCCVKG